MPYRRSILLRVGLTTVLGIVLVLGGAVSAAPATSEPRTATQTALDELPDLVLKTVTNSLDRLSRQRLASTGRGLRRLQYDLDEVRVLFHPETPRRRLPGLIRKVAALNLTHPDQLISMADAVLLVDRLIEERRDNDGDIEEVAKLLHLLIYKISPKRFFPIVISGVADHCATSSRMPNLSRILTADLPADLGNSEDGLPADIVSVVDQVADAADHSTTQSDAALDRVRALLPRTFARVFPYQSVVSALLPQCLRMQAGANPITSETVHDLLQLGLRLSLDDLVQLGVSQDDPDVLGLVRLDHNSLSAAALTDETARNVPLGKLVMALVRTPQFWTLMLRHPGTLKQMVATLTSRRDLDSALLALAEHPLLELAPFQDVVFDLVDHVLGHKRPDLGAALFRTATHAALLTRTPHHVLGLTWILVEAGLGSALERLAVDVIAVYREFSTVANLILHIMLQGVVDDDSSDGNNVRQCLPSLIALVESPWVDLFADTDDGHAPLHYLIKYSDLFDDLLRRTGFHERLLRDPERFAAFVTSCTVKGRDRLRSALQRFCSDERLTTRYRELCPDLFTNAAAVSEAISHSTSVEGDTDIVN